MAGKRTAGDGAGEIPPLNLVLDWERFAQVIQAMTQIHRWVGIAEVACLIDTSTATVKRYVVSGDLPAPTRMGTRRCAAAGPDRNGSPRRTQLHRWYLPSLIEHLQAEPRGWKDQE